MTPEYCVMLTTAILQTLAPVTAGLVTTRASVTHSLLRTLAAAHSCHLPLGCLLGAGTASLRRGGTGSWSHTTDTDECGNRAAVCYDGVLHYYMGDTLGITLGSQNQWLGEVGKVVREGPSLPCQVTRLH